MGAGERQGEGGTPTFSTCASASLFRRPFALKPDQGSCPAMDNLPASTDAPSGWPTRQPLDSVSSRSKGFSEPCLRGVAARAPRGLRGGTPGWPVAGRGSLSRGIAGDGQLP